MKAQLKKVLVELKDKNDELIGKTDTPDTVEGVIVSRGSTCELEAQEGDTVVFSGHAGIPFKKGGKSYQLLNEAEIYIAL